MSYKKISPDNSIFVVLSFEGPDIYSQAGGLGFRVTELSEALAKKGFETHVIFVGDPYKPSVETLNQKRLILHRWCQWISKYYPLGVYQGEEEKLYDYNESVPYFVLDEIARPVVKEKKKLVVLAEEWHTAECVMRLSDLLHYFGLRDKAVILWNANHTMSFHRINWGRLAFVATLTTVSRFMKHYMWDMGLNPIVIPNGVPDRMFQEVDEEKVARFREVFESDFLLLKVGRMDPNKRWNMAMDAVAELKRRGSKVNFLIRPGREPYGGEVIHNAERNGLYVYNLNLSKPTFDELLKALREARDADVLTLNFVVEDEYLRIFYNGCDAVLANSGMEPFGLVGLEVMACGGVVFTGCTGEEYAIPYQNAIVLETADPVEIVNNLYYLKSEPRLGEKIRREAKITAKRYAWGEVVDNLLRKIEYAAIMQKSDMGD